MIFPNPAENLVNLEPSVRPLRAASSHAALRRSGNSKLTAENSAHSPKTNRSVCGFRPVPPGRFARQASRHALFYSRRTPREAVIISRDAIKRIQLQIVFGGFLETSQCLSCYFLSLRERDMKALPYRLGEKDLNGFPTR